MQVYNWFEVLDNSLPPGLALSIMAGVILDKTQYLYIKTIGFPNIVVCHFIYFVLFT